MREPQRPIACSPHWKGRPLFWHPIRTWELYIILAPLVPRLYVACRSACPSAAGFCFMSLRRQVSSCIASHTGSQSQRSFITGCAKRQGDLLLYITKLPTHIRRIRQRIRSKHRRLRSRKKCKLQRTPRHVSDHPLRIVRTAQTILVQKFLFPGHIQPIQTPTSRSRSVRVEESAGLCLFKSAYPSDSKTHKVDRNLLVSKRHIPGDGLCGRASRTPISFILCRRRHAANQHQPHNCP